MKRDYNSRHNKDKVINNYLYLIYIFETYKQIRQLILNRK